MKKLTLLRVSVTVISIFIPFSLAWLSGWEIGRSVQTAWWSFLTLATPLVVGLGPWWNDWRKCIDERFALMDKNLNLEFEIIELKGMLKRWEQGNGSGTE